MSAGRKSNQDLVTSDIFALQDAELRDHITALQQELNRLKESVVPSVNECNALIALSHAELTSRSTDRMAKRALSLSVVAIVISCAAAVLPALIG
jgi:uncharacterized small protein (DUF1192 family)